MGRGLHVHSEIARFLAAAFLVSAVPASAQTAVDANGDFGWLCWTRFAIDGIPVTMWRSYFHNGSDGAYKIQVFGTHPHRTYWAIDPRPEGSPVKSKSFASMPRTEERVLSEGPDYVRIDFGWHTEAVGPIWAYYWGDGQYAGVEMLYTAKSVRKSTGRDGKMGGLRGGLTAGPIMTALAHARQWSVVAIDGTGKQLFSETFSPPMLHRSLGAYREARGNIDRLEAEFRVDHHTRVEGATICSDEESPDRHPTELR